MQTSKITAKPHYPILDGLRGVAAIIVVAFHIFETHATGPLDQVINHGYLAVDFFFMLSGFVIAYAYDDRWGRMGVVEFFKRRLIRLQPLVIFGMVVGAAFFYFQDSTLWPKIHEVPVWKLLLVMALGCTLIPLPTSMDIRGWDEMHPLDGTGWSLFFEYLANILYALVIRRFSKTLLSLLVLLAGGFLVHLTVAGPRGDVIGGWTLNATHLHIGFARMMYPFFAGMLLFRIAKPGRVKYAFLWSSLLLVALLAMPRIGGSERLWLNGIYESVVILLIFPAIIWLGASGVTNSSKPSPLCKFLGDISYPIYITHYPLIYLYTGWISNNKAPMAQAWPVALLVLGSAIALAYLSLKLYDIPVRRWLSDRFLSNGKGKI